jgi:hypothetical protein
MPRRAGKSWRAVAGLAFVADAKSAQAMRSVVTAIQTNASRCCIGARALHAGERFSMET